MKVRLFDEKVPVPERKITLRLLRIKDEIVVAIVGKDGVPIHRGHLIAFSQNMQLDRRRCIEDTLGLPLEAGGRLKEGRD